MPPTRLISMDHVIEFKKNPRLGKSKDNVERDVMTILRGFPKGKEDWADGDPQSPQEVTGLFNQVTLSHIPRADRTKMTCRELLQKFAQTVNPQSELHVAILAAASAVGMKLGKLEGKEVRSIMGTCLNEPESTLDGKRRATPKYILFLDMLHMSEVVANRAYELPIRRCRPFLNQAAHFTDRHFQFLQQYLSDGASNTIYKPEELLDSTCLRIPNVVFELYAEHFTREGVEGALQMHGINTNVKADKSGEETRQATNYVLGGREKGHLPHPNGYNPSTSHIRCNSQHTKQVNLPPTPLYKFLPLDRVSEGFRQTASKDIVGLAPALHRKRSGGHGLPNPFPQLCGFVQRQASAIVSMIESIRMRVVSLKGPRDAPPQAFRLDPGGSLRAPTGYLGLAVLLCDRAVDMIIVPDNKEVRWYPDQVLCFMDKAPKATDFRNRIFILLVLVELEPN